MKHTLNIYIKNRRTDREVFVNKWSCMRSITMITARRRQDQIVLGTDYHVTYFVFAMIWQNTILFQDDRTLHTQTTGITRKSTERHKLQAYSNSQQLHKTTATRNQSQQSCINKGFVTTSEYYLHKTTGTTPTAKSYKPNRNYRNCTKHINCTNHRD